MNDVSIHPEVQKNKDLYRDYKTSDRDTFTNNLIEDREFYFGEQFPDSIKNQFESEGRMATPVNEVLPAVDLIIQQLTENSPRFKATAREDSDVEVAYYVSRLYDYIWYISKGEVRIERYSRDFVTGGMGILFVYPDFQADNNRGEIKLTDLDPLYVYFDPDCKEPDGSDSQNIFISQLISEEVIKNNYPKIDLTKISWETGQEYAAQRAQTQGTISFPNMAITSKYARYIDRYTKIKIQKYNVFDRNGTVDLTFEKEEDFKKWLEQPAFIVTKLGQEQYISDDAIVEELLKIYKQYGEVYHLVVDPQTGTPIMVSGLEDEMSIPNSTTRLQLITKGDLIKNGIYELSQPMLDRIRRVLSIADQLVIDEVLPISNQPIIACMLHHNRNPYPCGDIRVVKPLQEQLNILDSRIQSYLQLITKLRVFTAKGSGLKKQIEANATGSGMDVYEVDYDTGTVPVFAQYPPLPAGIMQQRENLIRQIQRIIGAYAFQDGDVTQSPNTASGTTQIDEFMKRRSASKKRKIESSLNQVAKVISEYIPVIYDQRKVIRLVRPNHTKPEEIIFNDKQEEAGQIKTINDLSTFQFDIQIMSGSMLPSNRTQERAELLKSYEIGIIKNPKYYLMKTDFENIEEIIEEEDALKQAQNAIQQLQQQIEDLQGALQRKSNEVIQANEKVVVKNFETKIHKAGNDIDTAVQQHKNKLNAAPKKVNGGSK